MRNDRFETTEALEKHLSRMGAVSVSVPEGLAERAWARIAPELARKRERRRRVWTRLALASALALPLLLALNAITLWLLAAGLSALFPAPIAGGVAFLAGALMLLALSLTYGSIPILASLEPRLREEIP